MLSITNLVRDLFARSATLSRPRPAQRPVRLECLEERTLLSGWAIGVGGTGYDVGRTVVTDGAGNVYVTGTFSGTVDFDPGSGTTNLTSAGGKDIFVAKYSPTGSFVWARRAGGADPVNGFGDDGRGLALDSVGNVYVTGNYNANADFGPFTLTNASPGAGDVFVTKLDNSGTFLWADGFGSSGGDYTYHVALDGSNNIYLTGGFTGTVDFDPGPATYNLTSTGTRDLFALKLDSNGNFVWVQRGGAVGDVSQGYGVAVDSSGMYLSGRFGGTADFGATTLTSAGNQDIVVAKLDTTGNFVWASAMGGTASDSARGVAVDATGNVYVNGFFGATGTTADFDPGPGVFNLATAGDSDGFVTKLDASGGFVWAVPLGGTQGDQVETITLDGSGNVYTTGFVGAPAGNSATIDFDPGAGTAPLTVPANASDVFIWKLDSSANFLSARVMESASYGGGIWLDSSGAIYTAGYFVGTAYCDIGLSTVAMTSTGDADVFLVKTTQDVPTTPQLSRLVDNPDPAPKNSPLTLTAFVPRVVAGGSNVASVAFYRDKNGNGTLEVGTDTLLGTDTDGSNGWSLTTTAASKNGITSYFAQAKDSSNVAGNVVSARNRVGPGGPVASMMAVRPAGETIRKGTGANDTVLEDLLRHRGRGLAWLLRRFSQ